MWCCVCINPSSEEAEIGGSLRLAGQPVCSNWWSLGLVQEPFLSNKVESERRRHTQPLVSTLIYTHVCSKCVEHTCVHTGVMKRKKMSCWHFLVVFSLFWRIIVLIDRLPFLSNHFLAFLILKIYFTFSCICVYVRTCSHKHEECVRSPGTRAPGSVLLDMDDGNLTLVLS